MKVFLAPASIWLSARGRLPMRQTDFTGLATYVASLCNPLSRRLAYCRSRNLHILSCFATLSGCVQSRTGQQRKHTLSLNLAQLRDSLRLSGSLVKLRNLGQLCLRRLLRSHDASAKWSESPGHQRLLRSALLVMFELVGLQNGWVKTNKWAAQKRKADWSGHVADMLWQGFGKAPKL